MSNEILTEETLLHMIREQQYRIPSDFRFHGAFSLPNGWAAFTFMQNQFIGFFINNRFGGIVETIFFKKLQYTSEQCFDLLRHIASIAEGGIFDETHSHLLNVTHLTEEGIKQSIGRQQKLPDDFRFHQLFLLPNGCYALVRMRQQFWGCFLREPDALERVSFAQLGYSPTKCYKFMNNLARLGGQQSEENAKKRWQRIVEERRNEAPD